MNKTDHDSKMLELLSDEATYTKKWDSYGKKAVDRFNKEGEFC